jgi:hypothetical protein
MVLNQKFNLQTKLASNLRFAERKAKEERNINDSKNKAAKY